jgi:GNAT superfamily N-acetyltransferase
MYISEPFSMLDAPAWWALTGVQQQFAIGTSHAKRYQRGLLPFAACEPGHSAGISSLSEWLQPGEIFYLIGELPTLPAAFTLLKELPCVQMVLASKVDLPPADLSITPLNETHSEQLFHLINKVQPGYYEKDTWRLGNYYGIWQNDQLVACAGERMRLEGLTEISAICTHPAYTGRKYAQYLIAHLCNTNLQAGNIPFLHVLQTNERAIGLYEYLGFKQRRMIPFWQIESSKF